MLPEELYRKLKKVLKSPFNVVLLTHVNPDGDAIGSLLGMYWFLEALGCNVSMSTPNFFPHFLKWMEGADKIMNYSRESEKVGAALKTADILFFLDFNEPDRLAGMYDQIRDLEALTILVDHHPHPADFADYTLSDTSVSSTAELVYQLICELDGADLVDRRIAECLYTGIMTDTGCFSFNSSRPGTFGVAAELLRKGVDKDRIYSLVYNDYTTDRMRLLGYCILEKMLVIPELRTAYISLTSDELKRFNHKIGDTEGFVNYPFTIRDIRVSALFIEKSDHIKISLRSKGDFSINRIAREHFNGGGHLNAAGGESGETLADTIARFENVISTFADEIKLLP